MSSESKREQHSEGSPSTSDEDPKARRKNMLKMLAGKSVPTSVFDGDEVKVHTTESSMLKVALSAMKDLGDIQDE